MVGDVFDPDYSLIALDSQIIPRQFGAWRLCEFFLPRIHRHTNWRESCGCSWCGNCSIVDLFVGARLWLSIIAGHWLWIEKIIFRWFGHHLVVSRPRESIHFIRQQKQQLLLIKRSPKTHHHTLRSFEISVTLSPTRTRATVLLDSSDLRSHSLQSH